MSQICDPPDPVEVNDFKFVQLRKLKVTQQDESIPTDAIDLVATSSRYGLVFVGFSEGFKVLKLENILDLDEERDRARQPAEQYACQRVRCATPILLALSSDEMTLAVCTVNESRVAADMYDIRAFADPDKTPVPFLNVQLSQTAELRDFMWNPVVVEMYAFCLSDGSLHVHEINDVLLNIVAGLPAETGATSVCWSPKGKQLVVGKANGFFSQYKPTLQEVKKIPPPNIDGTGIEVRNICWLATTLFAVTYMPQMGGDDRVQTLILVSTPKGANITYTMFGDICFGSGHSRYPRYLMHHQSDWGVLICASTNAVETGVIGCINPEQSVWVQWALEDEGRAEVPLEKYTETYPLGVSVIFCAQRRIYISEQETYQPMPILFLLSTSGMLCPFHILNLRPGVVSGVYPSEPICCDGERKGNVALGPPVLQAQPQIQAAPITSPINTIMPTLTPITMKAASNMKSPFAMTCSSASFINSPESKPSFTFVKSEANTPTGFTPCVNVRNIQAGFSPVGAPSAIAPFQSLTSTPVKMTSAVPVVQPFQSAVKASPISQGLPKTVSPERTVLLDSRGAQLALVQMPASCSPEIPRKAESPPPPNADVYFSAMMEEIKKFETELVELKHTTWKSEVGTREELTELRKNSLLLEDFHKDMKDIMQSLSLDIHNIKKGSLESFAMVGEANSRKVRKNDPKYLSMLRERALDPMTAKRNQKIHQMHQYLSTQLQEVNDKLDQDWMEHKEKEKNKARNRLRMPSSQAVYQTMVNNQNIIYNLKTYLDSLCDGFSKLKLNSSSKAQRSFNASDTSFEGDLEKLADCLLLEKRQVEPTRKTPFGRKKPTPEIQTALRNALANRPITCVRPKPILSPSQSQILSTSILQSQKKSPVISAVQQEEQSVNPGEQVVFTPSPVAPAIAIQSAVSNVDQEGPKKLVFSTPPLELKPLSAFTLKPNQSNIFGRITEGTPVAKPMPITVPKATAVENPPGIVLLNQSSSAFTNLTPSGPTLSFNWKMPALQTADAPVFTIFSKKDDQPSNNQSSFGSFITKQDTNISNAGTMPVSFSKPRITEGFETMASPLYEDVTPPSSPTSFGEEDTTAEEQRSFAEGERKLLWNMNPTNLSSASSVFSFNKASTPGVQMSNVFVVSSAKDGQAVVQTSTLDRYEEILKVGSPTIDVVTSPSSVRTPFSSPTSTACQPLQTAAVDSSSNLASYTVPLQGPFGVGTADAAETVMSLVIRARNQNQLEVSSTSGGLLPLESASPNRSVGDHEGLLQRLDSNSTSTSQIYQVASPVLQSESSSSVLPLTPSTSVADPALLSSSTLSSFTGEQPKPEVVPSVSQPPVSTVATTSTTTTVGATPSFFGDTATTSTSSFFDSKPTFSSTVFGQSSAPSTTTSSFFSQPASTLFSKPASVFGGDAVTAAATTTASTTVFGQNTTAVSPFGQTTTEGSVGSFGQATTTTTAAVGLFGQTTTATSPTNLFGMPTVTTSSFIQPATSSVFGQPSSPFGQSNTTGSLFGQSAAFSSFFSPTSTDGSSTFGQKDQSTAGTSIFGGQSPGGFMKPAFGRSSTSTFGLTKAIFGQPAAQPSGQFGQSSEPTFGQGTFFGSLGGKPNEQNASKNVFGMSGSQASANGANSLFGNQGASVFGSKLGGFSAGSFSGGGGSVAQSGFGAFQQTSSKSAAFGAAPAFGSGATFGSPSGFGSSSTFGSTSPAAAASLNTNSAFGGATPAQPTFSNFAGTDAPSFGSLASQTGGFSQGTGFVQQQQQQQQQQPTQLSVFGGNGPAGSLFGNPGSPPGFGAPAPQQASFGSPSGGSSSAFTQWRS